jgi:hypothetical protein
MNKLFTENTEKIFNHRLTQINTDLIKDKEKI